MAKVPFSKLQLNTDIKSDSYSCLGKQGEDIVFEVKTYLPFGDKLELVSRIVNQSIDDNGYFNPMRVELFTALELVYTYTNLSFTDKMKEDGFKLYDTLRLSGILNKVLDTLHDNGELEEVNRYVSEVIKNIYSYKNSAAGIMEMISQDYGELDLNATEIQKKLADPNNLALLKDVITKLG
jgi:hypothetical protein